MHNLSYGGINSEDYSAYITNAGIYKSPEKRYRKYTVPGRNGDLLEDTGTFENVEVKYPFCVYENCDTNFRAYVAALKRKKGYQRIEDTFHPEYYRMGAFLDEFEPKEVTADGEMCNGVLKFDCMPQKWLKSGEEPICIIEGTFRNYVSTDDEPDIPSEATMRTGYMSVPSDMSVTVKLHNEHDDAYVLIVGYNSQGVETYQEFLVPEYERWLPSGDYQAEIEFPAGTATWEFYYNITGSYIGEVLTVGNTNAEFIYTLTAFGESRNIDAILREKVEIQNPTGYATKPIIEYFAYYDSNIKITNLYSNGEDAEYYELSFDMSGETNKHIFLDCDQQYAYNSDGKNVSNIMSILTAESAGGKSLVFPEFGTDTIRIEFLYRTDVDSISQHNTIIFVYPRWWTTT